VKKKRKIFIIVGLILAALAIIVYFTLRSMVYHAFRDSILRGSKKAGPRTSLLIANQPQNPFEHNQLQTV
jgi:sensor domain CHASE-containing protein